MKVLKFVSTVLALVLWCVLSGCSSAPKQTEPYDYNGALPELKRNGVPVWHSQRAPHDITSRTCTSTPIYDLDGYFVRYDLRCY